MIDISNYILVRMTYDKNSGVQEFRSMANATLSE
jgi:hypothetical protein